MHKVEIIKSGNTKATKALVLLHGRGGSVQDMFSLTSSLNTEGFAFYAPQATNNSWYPQSFLANPALNEPWLSSALDLVSITIKQIEADGIDKEHIFFLGFSQGACLTAEFVARNASKYGGVVIFTGGLIGDEIILEKYKGSFDSTPIFVGTSNPDFHVPVERVYATTNILKDLGASVTEKVYENMGHTINQDEINSVNDIIFKN